MMMFPSNIVLALDEHLKPIGFNRKGSTWNRRFSGFVEVIDLQVSKSRDRVTANAGVLDPLVYKTVWGEEPPEFVKEPISTVRVRVGELLDQRDWWWASENQEVSGEIIHIVNELILPFLQRMRSREQMISWLGKAEVVKRRQHPETLALAVLMNLMGRNTEACKIVTNTNISFGAWRSRYEEVASRLGCTQKDDLIDP
jgi:hypothetical protein